MKILAGAVAILLLAVCAMGYQLKQAWGETATARRETLQAEQALGEQRQQTALVLGRLDTLDSKLTQLDGDTKLNAQQLELTLDAIGTIQKSEGDSDDALKCLDVRMPAQLADRVR